MSELGEHKGDGIRYAMHLSAPKGGSAQMLCDPDGNWVSWEDYARLQADVERLKEGNECLNAFHDKEMERSAYLLEELTRLKAEVEHLTSENLLVREEADRYCRLWQEAKEGKQS